MIKANDIREFMKQHPTFWDKLSIPENHFTEFFGVDPTFHDKQTFYNHYRKSLNKLLDQMELMPVPNFDVALYEIKNTKIGYCLPIRFQNWGWKEPRDVDELEDYLKKLFDRWDSVRNRALERLKDIQEKKKTIQKKLVKESDSANEH